MIMSNGGLSNTAKPIYEYLDKLIPLLSADKPAQKKMMDNAKTMLNFIDSQVK